MESKAQLRQAIRSEIETWSHFYGYAIGSDEMYDLTDSVVSTVEGVVKEIYGMDETCEDDDEHYN